MPILLEHPHGGFNDRWFASEPAPLLVIDLQYVHCDAFLTARSGCTLKKSPPSAPNELRNEFLLHKLAGPRRQSCGQPPDHSVQSATSPQNPAYGRAVV